DRSEVTGAFRMPVRGCSLCRSGAEAEWGKHGKPGIAREAQRSRGEMSAHARRCRCLSASANTSFDPSLQGSLKAYCGRTGALLAVQAIKGFGTRSCDYQAGS